MQFVKAGRYGEAIRFLEAVIGQYRLDPVEEFCAGQIAIGEVLGLYDNYDAQLGICAQVKGWRVSGYTPHDYPAPDSRSACALVAHRFQPLDMPALFAMVWWQDLGLGDRC